MKGRLWAGYVAAASVVAATTDPTFAVQQQTKTIAGTSNNDIIYVADPNRMPSGTTERLIDINALLPDAGMVAKTATITNLPAGFAINNATFDGTNWKLDLNSLDPNHLQLALRYVLPAEGATPDVNGFLSNFTLNILFTAQDASGLD